MKTSLKVLAFCVLQLMRLANSLPQFNAEFWENLKDCKDGIEDLSLRGLCYQFKHEENPFGVKQEEETCWSMKSEKRCYYKYIDKATINVDDFKTDKPIDEEECPECCFYDSQFERQCVGKLKVIDKPGMEYHAVPNRSISSVIGGLERSPTTERPTYRYRGIPRSPITERPQPAYFKLKGIPRVGTPIERIPNTHNVRDNQFWGLLMECRTIEDQPKRNRCYENVHRRFPFGKSRDESMNSPQEENDNPIPRIVSTGIQGLRTTTQSTVNSNTAPSRNIQNEIQNCYLIENQSLRELCITFATERDLESTNTQRVIDIISGCPDGWTVNPDSGLCYKFTNEVSDWYGANKTCNEMVKNVNGNFVGGLAKVDSEQENEFLKGLINEDKKEVGYWIGANDIENEGSWQWADGSTVTLFDWHNREPNNQMNDEDCVVIGYDFWKPKSTRTVKWYDEGCTSWNQRLYAPICTIQEMSREEEASVLFDSGFDPL